MFDLNFLLSGDYRDWLVSGLLLSLQLMGVTLLLSLPLACGVAMLRLAPSRLLNCLGAAYVELIRNVPLLAHFLFWYFGAPELLPDTLKERLYAGNIEAASAIAALTLYTAAYMAEDIRAGILAIPAGQTEAARAFGMPSGTLLRRIVLPQALRIATPALGNEVVSLLKATALVSTITVFDLTGVARRLSNESYTTDALVLAGVVYGALTLLISAGVHFLERRRKSQAA